MGTFRKLLCLLLWCSISLQNCLNVQAQGYYYTRQNVNQYHLINGKFQPMRTTTPPPSLLETIFPWTGSSYDSAKTPEEDAAILNSLMDSDIAAAAAAAAEEGYLSWLRLPSMPSMPSMPEIPLPEISLPSMTVTFPTYGGSSSSAQETETKQSPTGGFPGNQYPFNNPNGITYQDANFLGSSSQSQPVVVQGPSSVFADVPPQQQQFPPQLSAFSPPLQNPNYIGSQDLKQIPTFQFHQQMKDSIPLPTPSISSSFGQQMPMFPYPYSAPTTNSDFLKNSNEKTISFLDLLSNYFTFGKRSDLENLFNPEQLRQFEQLQMSIANGDTTGVIESRSYDENENENVEELRYHKNEQSDDIKAPGTDPAEWLCPKTGIWRWNGEVCIAQGPRPIWACKPNDLVVSGKIAICRNKVYFSPTYINT